MMTESRGTATNLELDAAYGAFTEAARTYRKPLVDLVRDEYEAKLWPGSPTGHDGYTLIVGDYVAQEYAEWYADLSTALARMAVLDAAVAAGQTFTDTPEDFAGKHAFFLAATLA